MMKKQLIERNIKIITLNKLLNDVKKQEKKENNNVKLI